MIDFLTHYYARDAEPFRSLSALPDERALEKMRGMYREGSVFWARFGDPAGYLQTRRQVERWLHAEFLARGGRPRRTYPIYMVLGRPRWTEEMADPVTLETATEIRVPLALFTEQDISFTYPDSMVSAMAAEQQPPGWYEPEYHGRVFTLSEVRYLVERKGMPDEGWETRAPRTLPHYIEAQVWNPEPLIAMIRGPSAGAGRSGGRQGPGDGPSS